MYFLAPRCSPRRHFILTHNTHNQPQHTMWIYLNNSHISIVETPDKDKPKFDDVGRKYLSVRARSVEDLKAFARVDDEDIVVTDDRDYACRTFLPRHRVAGLLFESCCDIDYTNFKDSIAGHDTDRKFWYGSVWSEGLTHQIRNEPDSTKHYL